MLGEELWLSTSAAPDRVDGRRGENVTPPCVKCLGDLTSGSRAMLDCRYYDYNEPTAVPDELRGSVDYILMDPPYLVSSLLDDGDDARLAGP